MSNVLPGIFTHLSVQTWLGTEFDNHIQMADNTWWIETFEYKKVLLNISLQLKYSRNNKNKRTYVP